MHGALREILVQADRLEEEPKPGYSTTEVGEIGKIPASDTAVYICTSSYMLINKQP
jgi:hypothetical protein